ncbi:MAG: UvrD-helicase domain-containing protein [Planctomycetia bacterium]|nr:UvrD-helicase domain-containing protein [Planctomycetia bacterium]
MSFSYSNLLVDLTLPQQEAVTHRDGPLLVLAGPGSGKTRVVTHRVTWLLGEGVAPESLLVLTFTNKAAQEMQQRLVTLAGHSSVWISTFHRFCARLLRQYASEVGFTPAFTIYDSPDTLAAVRHAVKHLQTHSPSFADIHFSADSLAHSISQVKNRFLDVSEFEPRPGDARGELLRELLPVYQKTLHQANSMDFDDLLLHTVRLLRENPALRSRLDAQFQYILVDEYQDTNLAQYAIARLLATDVPNLMVTGDPDQSIYSWRGANIRNILEFERDYPQAKILRLEENYRSTPNILAVADHLIQHNTQRKPKRLFTRKSTGKAVRLQKYTTASEEAATIAAEIAHSLDSGQRRPEDFAVFYRMNALSVELEKAFRLRQIPFQIVHGTAFFERAEIRDAMAWMRLVTNPEDNEAFLRVVNLPSRGVGKVSLEHLHEFAWEHGISLLDAACRAEECASLKKRALAGLKDFVEKIESLQKRYREILPERKMAPFFQELLETTGLYRTPNAADADWYNEEELQRLKNLEVFVSLAEQLDASAEFSSLETFLERISLTADSDTVAPGQGVSLMTLHASKGLEFPVVYLVAVEDGILPHERSRESIDALEEERRLLFVGMTRAKEELTLSFVQDRQCGGFRKNAIPSPLLLELPQEVMEMSASMVIPEEPSEPFASSESEWNQEIPYEEPVYQPPTPPEEKKTLPKIPGVMTAAELLQKKSQRGS